MKIIFKRTCFILLMGTNVIPFSKLPNFLVNIFSFEKSANKFGN